MDRATLLARAMYAINSLDTETLAVEVAKLERIAPLCLPVEASEHQEDCGAGGFLRPTPEGSDLQRERT